MLRAKSNIRLTKRRKIQNGRKFGLTISRQAEKAEKEAKAAKSEQARARELLRADRSALDFR